MSRKPNPFKAIEAKMPVKERRLRQGRRTLISTLRKRLVAEATEQKVPTQRIAQLAEMTPLSVSQLVHKMRAEGKIKSKAVRGGVSRKNETLHERFARKERARGFVFAKRRFLAEQKINEKIFERMISSYKSLFGKLSYVQIQTTSPEKMAYELLNSKDPQVRINAPYSWVYTFVTWAKVGDWAELKQ